MFGKLSRKLNFKPVKKLAIVIINWNSYDLTRDTLLSLQKTSFTNYDIILVDNHSTDGSLEKLQSEFSFPIFIQLDENKGFTGGNNAGMQYAVDHQYEYTLLLNNDVEVEPDFLEPLIATLDHNPKTGAVQPLIYFHHNRSLLWNAGATYNTWLGMIGTIGYNKKDEGQAQIHKPRNTDWITGCAFMVRTELLKQIGFFPQKLFIYYEDFDLSLRIKNAGYDLAYIPKSKIYHIAGMAHKTKEKAKEGYVSPKVHYLNSRNRIWILKKHTSGIKILSVIIAQLIYFSAISFYFILRRRWQKLKAWHTGIKEGLLDSI